MRPIHAITIAGALALALALMFLATDVTAQRRGGFGGRGGFDRGQFERIRAKAGAMRTPDVGWLWAALSFEMTLTDEQTPQVRALLKSTWKQKRDIIAEASRRKDADWKKTLDGLQDLRKTMEQQLQGMLTEDQSKQLDELRKQRRELAESLRPGRFSR